MAIILPGNILFGGGITSNMSSKYRSLGHLLLEKLKETGESVLLIDAVTGREYTAKYIHDEALRLAQVLQQLGVKAGDVVSISSENRYEFVISLFGALAINATVAPINTTYTKREVDHALNLSKPKIIFASEQSIDIVTEVAKQNSFVKVIVTYADKISQKFNTIYTLKELLSNHAKFPSNAHFQLPVAENKMEDVAIIVCSSGTTGLPKGVQLTQNNVLRTLDLQFSNSTVPPGLTAFSVIPWFHAFGCFVLIYSAVINTTTVYLPKFNEQLFLQAIEKYRVALSFMVPPLMVFLAKHPLVDKYDLSSLMILVCGSAPLSKETEDQVKERIGVPIIRQGYGLSESTLSVLVQDDEACSPGSVGALKGGIYAKVVDTETGENLGPNKRGELCFKGETIMKGYIGDIKSTQTVLKDGWLHTGDVGYYTEKLEFFIVDRIKELIKYKGFQVAPAEIEALLLTHQQIKDAAVIGRPDEAAGELPMAFVVPQAGAKITEKDVIEFVRANASPAKHLRGGVIFIKDIPKNPSGKILRRFLRDMLKTQPKSKL